MSSFSSNLTIDTVFAWHGLSFISPLSNTRVVVIIPTQYPTCQESERQPISPSLGYSCKFAETAWSLKHHSRCSVHTPQITSPFKSYRCGVLFIYSCATDSNIHSTAQSVSPWDYFLMSDRTVLLCVWMFTAEETAYKQSVDELFLVSKSYL